MEAVCQNENCEKDDWTLRKHPSEYARGGPTCPECGTTDISFEGRQQEPQPQQQRDARRGQQPEVVEEGGQRGDVPARQEDMQESIARGMELGESVYQIQSGDHAERTEAKGKLLQTFGSAVAKMGQQYVEEEKQQRERAKRASDDDISVAEEYPRCPMCDAQLKGIPAGQEFNCPSCGEVLEYSGGA